MKEFTLITAQENHLQIAITLSDHNPLIRTITAEDLQTDGIHKIVHKTDKVDHTAKLTNIAITIQNQTQIEIITQTIIETGCYLISRKRYYSKDRSKNSSYNQNQNYSNDKRP